MSSYIFNSLTYLDVCWTSAHLDEFAPLIAVKSNGIEVEIAYFVIDICNLASLYRNIVRILDIYYETLQFIFVGILRTRTQVLRQRADHPVFFFSCNRKMTLGIVCDYNEDVNKRTLVSDSPLSIILSVVEKGMTLEGITTQKC
jgi:hypothetical protein